MIDSFSAVARVELVPISHPFYEVAYFLFSFDKLSCIECAQFGNDAPSSLSCCTGGGDFWKISSWHPGFLMAGLF